MSRTKVIQDNPKATEGLLGTAEMCKEWNCLSSYLEMCVTEGMPRVSIDGIFFFDLKKCQKWYATTGTPRKEGVKWKIPKEAEGLLTHSELCKLWPCSKPVIKRNVKRGMPVHKIGNREYFDLKECQKWMEGGEI